MTRVRLLVVLALALTAGCAGLGEEANPPDRDPYGVDDPLESAVATTDDVPGLTADGFENVSILEAHDAALENRSYTIEVTEDVRTADGRTLLESTQSVAVNRTVSTGTERLRGLWNPADDDPHVRSTVEHWHDVNGTIQRVETDGEPVEFYEWYEVREPPSVYQFTSAMLAASDATVEPMADGGVHVTATNPREESTFVADEPFVLELSIRADGIVERASLEGTIRQRGAGIRVTHEMWYTAIDETTPTRPDWYRDARAELDADPSRASDDG